jgi:KRAB domain-containing zinc finger protein
MKVHGRGIIGSVEYSTKAAECPICHQMFSEERLKYHIRLHEASTFKCGECEKEFRTAAAAEKHLANSHGNEKRFTCSLCGKSFAKLTILKQHEEIHNPIKIYVQCEICNTMMQVKSLKLHMDIKHSDKYNEKRHVCECGKAFRYEKQLQKHSESVHQKVSRGIVYPCLDCDLAFNRRLELREHSFEHFTGKIFECKCGMKFKKRKLLTIHEAVHKNNRWPCDFCTLTFQTRGGRRKHQSKVHGQVVEEVLEIPSFEAAVCNAVIEVKA